MIGIQYVETRTFEYMSAGVEISVVVPVYNSSRILPELVGGLSKVLHDNFETYEIILVDDCSPDESRHVIMELSAIHPFIRGFQTIRNLGQFSTTLQGVSQAKGRYIVNIDDDLEYAPEDIPLLYQRLKRDSKSIVFGLSPVKYQVKGSSPFLSRWRNRFLNGIWNKGVTDSFRIFKREVVFDDERFLPDVHFEAFISRKVGADEMGYVEVSYHRRHQGVSNYLWHKKAYAFIVLCSEYWRINLLIVLFSLLSGSMMGFLIDWRIGLAWLVWMLPASYFLPKWFGAAFKPMLRELGTATIQAKVY